MPINILMPALSPTMEKGNLAKWLKKEGDQVKSGDVIAEIETDKATMEVEAVDEGVLAKIVVPEGTADVPVNNVIAVLAGEGEDAKAAAAGAGQGAAPKAAPQQKGGEAGPAKASGEAVASKSPPTPASQEAGRPSPPQVGGGMGARGGATVYPPPLVGRVARRKPRRVGGLLRGRTVSTAACSPRRSRGGSPRKPASISRACRAPGRMAA